MAESLASHAVLGKRQCPRERDPDSVFDDSDDDELFTDEDEWMLDHDYDFDDEEPLPVKQESGVQHVEQDDNTTMLEPELGDVTALDPDLIYN